jgi:hypothetical protein
MRWLPYALILSLALFISNPVYSEDTSVKAENTLRTYLNQTNLEVKNADLPAEKRQILNASLHKLDTVMKTVQQMPGVTEAERDHIQAYRSSIREKTDELNGKNGYKAVPDTQLDAFSNYVVQDFEQADRRITISLTTVLLIVIILLLL